MARNDIAGDLMRGALAGAVATFALDRVDWFLYRREPEASRRRTWAARPDGKDPAHVAASRVSVALGGDPVPQGHPLGLATHYAIGIAPAALYGALREQAPAVTAGSGLAFGAALWVLEDEVVNPALGLAAPPGRYPWQPHARGLVAHLVYGVVAELTLRALKPRPAPRRRRRPF